MKHEYITLNITLKTQIINAFKISVGCKVKNGAWRNERLNSELNDLIEQFAEISGLKYASKEILKKMLLEDSKSHLIASRKN